MSLAGEESVADLEIRLPEAAGDLTQDEEWYELSLDGETRRVRFHDYAQTYSIPGVYERLFYDTLKCDSPRTVCGLLGEHLEDEGRDPSELRVLDVGAGNGMVGEQLAELGAEEIVGVDILEEAAQAAERDRPGLYDDYLVVDLTDLPEPRREELRSRRAQLPHLGRRARFRRHPAGRLRGGLQPDRGRRPGRLLDQGGDALRR